MNSFELRLLELVQVAESPVYSTFRWLSRQVGHDLAMAEFFRVLNSMVDRDVVRLWAVDAETHERSRWHEVPLDIERRYAEIADLDDSFDPLGLSLTLGPAADVEAAPEWGVDFDFDQARFVMTATLDSVEDAWRQIGRLFPDIDFVEVGRATVAGGVRIEGSISEQRLSSGDRP
jgi:hypothetical protein